MSQSSQNDNVSLCPRPAFKRTMLDFNSNTCVSTIVVSKTVYTKEEIEECMSVSTDSDEEEQLLTSWHHRALLGDEHRVPYCQERNEIQDFLITMKRRDDAEDADFL